MNLSYFMWFRNSGFRTVFQKNIVGNTG